MGNVSGSIELRASCGPSRYVNYNGFRLVIFDSPPTFFRADHFRCLSRFNFEFELLLVSCLFIED
jgi:hypothetical protein